MEDTASNSFPSLLKRLGQVFFSPGELFTTLRKNPVWFEALAVAVGLAVLAVALFPTELWVEFSRARMIEQGQEVPAGFEQWGPFIRILSVFGGGLAFFVMAFVFAGIVTFFFAFLFGDEGRYVQYLAVVAHASVITGMGALFLVPLKMSQGDPSVTLSVGTFAFFLEEGYLYRVLKMLDLFALWSYVVMAVGVTKIDPRRSFGFAMSFFVAFAVAFAMLFGIWGG